MTEQKVTKHHKDTLFRAIFSKEENLAELYAALSGQSLDAKQIKLKTIEEVIYVTRKNDVAFTVDDKVVVLIEHQSTICGNLPLRMLSYISKIYEKLIERSDIYQAKRVPLPTPEFYVFYNGKTPRPLRETLCLSDSYIKPVDKTQLELQVDVINVNYETEIELLRKCGVLNIYSLLVSRYKELRQEGYADERAMALVIEELNKDELGRKFVQDYKLEGISMLFEEITEEEYRDLLREEAQKDGYAQGMEQGIEEGIEEGIEQSVHNTATKMKKEGLPIETIIKITGLSQEQIDSL